MLQPPVGAAARPRWPPPMAVPAGEVSIRDFASPGKFHTMPRRGGILTIRSKAATMDVPSNIFLIGSMGAGKSTIGRRLATALDKEFMDADQVLEEQTGVGIPLIFELEGEAGFRKRESEVLARLVAREGIVLATGGGVVLSAQNRAHLRQRGFVVYLEAPADLLVGRISRSRNRPLMQTEDPEATMRELVRVRDPLYRECADLIVRSTHRSRRFVVGEILQRIEAL